VFSEARGAWLISRFDQVMDAFADYEHFSSEGRVGTMLDHFTNEEWAQLEEMQRYAELKGIIHVDPPDHRRLRALVMRGFKRRTI
jgi:cytochrome P450